MHMIHNNANREGYFIFGRLVVNVAPATYDTVWGVSAFPFSGRRYRATFSSAKAADACVLLGGCSQLQIAREYLWAWPYTAGPY